MLYMILSIDLIIIHDFTNNGRGLVLMARAAEHVIKEHKDIVMAFDELSFEENL